MTSATVPTVPNGYDEPRAAGWTYHRNGICGCGFYAKVEDGALHVAWSVADEADEPEVYPVAVSVPLPVLAGIARMPAVGPEHRHTSAHYSQTYRHVFDDDGTELYAIDFAETSNSGPPVVELEGRILVVADPTDGDPDRYAAFVLSEVLDGDASTTLRGDNFHGFATAAAVVAKAWR